MTIENKTSSMNSDPGETIHFKKAWQTCPESLYNHWTSGEPENQVQLAFRNHWTLFKEFMDHDHYGGGKRVLEVGCGRGSLSCYFSSAGYECTLLDVSPHAIEIAKKIFQANQLQGSFLVGDACSLSFPDQSFDVVFSIGLLEHFEDSDSSLVEQIRVLASGGLFLGYIVPHYQNNVQSQYDWINEILKGYCADQEEIVALKPNLFRSDKGSERYLPILQREGLVLTGASGVYPIPMISHSMEFPFTLMPSVCEKSYVRIAQKWLAKRHADTNKHPWLCPEGEGQAFLVWGYKT